MCNRFKQEIKQYKSLSESDLLNNQISSWESTIGLEGYEVRIMKNWLSHFNHKNNIKLENNQNIIIGVG